MHGLRSLPDPLEFATRDPFFLGASSPQFCQTYNKSNTFVLSLHFSSHANPTENKGFKAAIDPIGGTNAEITDDTKPTGSCHEKLQHQTPER